MEPEPHGERARAGAAASLVAGLLAGLLLDPAGGAWPVRAAAATAALGCAGRARWAVAPLLIGLTAALAALLLAPAPDLALEPVRGPSGADLALAAALAAIGLSARRRARPGDRVPREPEGAGAPPDAPGRWRARGGALAAVECAAAAAVSAAMLAAARITLRASPGEVGDATVWAATTSALAALGAVALGRTLARAGAPAVALGLVGASAACFATLPLVAGVTAPDGFAALCARIGRSPADFGTLGVDALLFATTSALPALLVGAALAGAASGLRLAALLASALAGAPLARLLFDLDATSLEAAEASAGGVAVVARAAALAGAAGVLAAALARGHAASRVVLAGLGALAVAAGTLAPLSPIHPRVPWRRFPVAPTAVFEAPSGQYTIEPTRGGGARVLRDHAPITPAPDEVPGEAPSEARAERAQLRDWARAAFGGGAPPDRVVVLGIATPERARALAELGIERFDRTGVPAELGPLLERALFRDGGDAPPPGEFLAAPDRIDLAFRVGARELAGPGGLLAPGLERPHAVRVAASHAGVPAGGGWAIAGSDGLRAFWLERGGALPIGGGHAPSALRRLGTPVRERERAALRSLVRRAAPPSGDPLAPLQRALVAFADLQRISSPFESPDERVEVDAPVLSALSDHLARRAPGALTELERSVAEGAADALVAQREVPWIHAFLGPIAEAHAPWPRLVLALAAADVEELRPEEAADRLEAAGIEPR